MNSPIEIAYFGPDARDAAIKRRIISMIDSGFAVRAYTMRRQDDMTHEWDNVDLGFVRHVAFLRRIGAMARAIWILRAHQNKLRNADVWIARNLDLLVVAFIAHKITNAKAPLIYECLDIHRLMTRRDWVGKLMRRAEGFILRQCADVIISSPGFLVEYFQPHYGESVHATVIENRLPPNRVELGPRPDLTAPHTNKKRLTLGWYGVLRCKRSLALMRAAAEELPDKIQVVLHGFTKKEDLPDFESKISGLPNLRFEGRYSYPGDLSKIYRDVDLVWAGDYHDAEFNSRWLLPNRLYEGGYFGVVPVAAADTETGRWISRNGVGFVVNEPIEKSLIEFLSSVTSDQIEERRNKLISADISLFIQPENEIKNYIGGIVRLTDPSAPHRSKKQQNS